MLLGIHDHCSPYLASEVSIMAVVLSSFQETSNIMKERGTHIGVNTIRKIAQRFSLRAQATKVAEPYLCNESVAGYRVVVSTDGGRVRIRKNKRGPKTSKGRSRYSTDWKEPKLLAIYAIGADGKMNRNFHPFIDGTMKGPDAVFDLIEYYLSNLDITKATKILFIADGARWIWNRVGSLMKSLGIEKSKYHELVDFYHAVEHLSKFADLRKGWNKKERKRWIKKHRRLLLKGGVDQVIEAIREICRGRHGKKLTTEKNYFIRNRHRMCYDTLKEINFPIGSGAIESAVRRVINLRFKGASIYWLEQTVEAMIKLRAFYKAGRWEVLKNLAFSSNLDSFEASY
jgi:hypothetical protein